MMPMCSCNRIFMPVLICLMIGFTACNSDSNYLLSSKAGAKTIDLFREDKVAGSAVHTPINLDAETAFKQSSFVVSASDIKLIDSSYNRTTGDNFYLYRAMGDSTIKGAAVKKGTRIYFTAYQKLAATIAGTYQSYLVKLPGHALIKQQLNVQWQWLNNAPVRELKIQNGLAKQTY